MILRMARGFNPRVDWLKRVDELKKKKAETRVAWWLDWAEKKGEKEMIQFFIWFLWKRNLIEKKEQLVNEADDGQQMGRWGRWHSWKLGKNSVKLGWTKIKIQLKPVKPGKTR